MPKDLEEQNLAAMIHDNIDIYRFIVHAQHVDKNCLRKRNR